MGIQPSTDIKIYDSLEELPIFNFDKCIRGNLSYMIKNEEEREVEITKEITDKWEELYNEYCKLTKNNTAITIYLLLGEISYLETRLQVVPILIKFMLKAQDVDGFNEVVKEITQWGIPIDRDAPLEDEIEKIYQFLENSKTKIKRKIGEYKDLTKKEGEVMSLLQQKVKLSTILKMDIDIKKTSVIGWLQYWKEVEVLSRKKKVHA